MAAVAVARRRAAEVTFAMSGIWVPSRVTCIDACTSNRLLFSHFTLYSEGLKAVQTIEAMYRSINTGQVVAVEL